MKDKWLMLGIELLTETYESAWKSLLVRPSKGSELANVHFALNLLQICVIWL